MFQTTFYFDDYTIKRQSFKVYIQYNIIQRTICKFQNFILIILVLYMKYPE